LEVAAVELAAADATTTTVPVRLPERTPIDACMTNLRLRATTSQYATWYAEGAGAGSPAGNSAGISSPPVSMPDVSFSPNGTGDDATTPPTHAAPRLCRPR